MIRDSQSLPIASDAPDVATAVDRFTRSLLAYGTDAGAILEARDADPGCVLASTLSAALFLLMETGDGARRAAPFLSAAEPRLAAATDREKALHGAVSAWAGGDTATALARLRDIARGWPRDLAAAKIGEYHAFNLGRFEDMRALAETILPANREVGYVHGMLAFALEQCNDLKGAERAGRRATDMDRADPWAHHAVAHVLETQGRIDEGIAWMEGLADSWAGCNSFMLTHNWWHTALYYIDRGDGSHALSLYDAHVRGVDPGYSQVQVNAVSLLARLELHGIDVGGRWDEVGAHLAGRTGDHVNGFLDLHYLYGLARAGRADAVAAMLDSLQQRAAHALPFEKAVWSDIALPAARALAAHAEGDWSRAADGLGKLLPHLVRLGGSHAQRDLFAQIHLDALIRAGRAAEARAVLDRRLADRPRVPSLHRQRLALAS